jgi:hypothetical protein
MRKASKRKKSTVAKARRHETYICLECHKVIIGPAMHYGNSASSTNAYCTLCFNP